VTRFSFRHVGRSQLPGNTPQHHRFSGLDCSRFADEERSEPKPVAEPQPNTAVQKLTLVKLRSLGLEPLRGSYRLHSAKKPWGTVSHIMMTSLRSKWAVGAIGRGTFSTRFRNVWHDRDAPETIDDQKRCTRCRYRIEEESSQPTFCRNK
jgi:hypothetical protein